MQSYRTQSSPALQASTDPGTDAQYWTVISVPDTLVPDAYTYAMPVSLTYVWSFTEMISAQL